MAGLSHPNLLPVYDVGAEPDRVWYVMELARHGWVRRWLDLQARAARLRLACVAMIQVLDGLAFVHDRGIVHRDVKPGNVLVTAGGRAKLADFGAARYRARPLDLTATGDTLGTLDFVAPEQELDPRDATAASDLYGVGATLFHLVARPPEGALPLLYLSELSAEEHRSVPPAVLDVIRRATRTDPEDRYPDARAMRRALQDAADALP